MTQNVDIASLAKLARLEVSAEELSRLEQEIPAILEFVKTVQEVSANAPADVPGLRNVMRDDAEPHESGVYTDDLLAAAPAVKDGQVVVKQVITRKK